MSENSYSSYHYEEDYQEEQYEDYSASGEGSEVSKGVEEKPEARINIANKAAVTLNVGSRSQVCINPGPNGAFQISFKTEEDGVEN